MSELEVEQSTALVLAHTGELVDLSDERQVAKAFRDVQDIQRKLAEANRRLREALVEQAAIQGTKTMYLDGIGKVELKGGQEVTYDELAIEEDLRKLGCPEEVIREIVKETIIYKIDGRRAKSAAAANPEYGKVIESHKTVTEKLPTVSIT